MANISLFSFFSTPGLVKHQDETTVTKCPWKCRQNWKISFKRLHVVFLFGFNNVDRQNKHIIENSFNFDFPRHEVFIITLTETIYVAFSPIPESFSSFPLPPILEASTTPHRPHARLLIQTGLNGFEVSRIAICMGWLAARWQYPRLTGTHWISHFWIV